MLMHRSSFNNLVNELNRVLDNKLQKQYQQDDSAVESANWLPAVDIIEEPDQFVLQVDVPGVDPNEIELSMKDNVLCIMGSRVDIQKEDKKNYHRVESVRGSFYRRFTLPDTADGEQITAKSKHGVLEICVRKKKIPESRKIKIKMED